jgi:hypothetical protein
VEEQSVAAHRFKPGEPENVKEAVHFGGVDGFRGVSMAFCRKVNSCNSLSLFFHVWQQYKKIVKGN